MQLLRTIHPYLALILLVSYGWLALRLFRRKKEELEPFDRLLSQVARITLLVAYFSGLVMSMNLAIWAPKLHHTTSLIPVAVLFFFQFFPQFLQRQISIRWYAMMFLGMFLSVLIISATSGILPNL